MARYLLYICILAIIFSVAFSDEHNNRNSNAHKNHQSWKKVHNKPEEKINNVNTIPNNQQPESNKPIEHNKPNKHVNHHKNAGKAKESAQKIPEQVAPQKLVEQKAPEPIAPQKEQQAKPIENANPQKLAKRHESLDDLAKQDAIGDVLPEEKKSKEEIKPEEPKTDRRKPAIKKTADKMKPKKQESVKNPQASHSAPAEKTVANRKSYGNYHHKPSKHGYHHKQRETQYKFCTFVSLNCSGNAFCLDIETTDCYLLPNGDSMKLYIDAITASALYYVGDENCAGYSPPIYLNQTYTCVPNPLVARSYKVVPGKRIDRFYTKQRKHYN